MGGGGGEARNYFDVQRLESSFVHVARSTV